MKKQITTSIRAHELVPGHMFACHVSNSSPRFTLYFIVSVRRSPPILNSRPRVFVSWYAWIGKSVQFRETSLLDDATFIHADEVFS